MRRIWIIGLLLAAVVMTTLWHRHRSAPQIKPPLALTVPAEAVVSPVAKAPKELRLRPDGSEYLNRDDRFKYLDPQFKPLAIELEKSAIEWNRTPHDAPSRERAHALWHDQSMKEVSRLDTSQIVGLANWLVAMPSSAARNYRAALYETWGSRDAPAAMVQVLGRYESLENKTWGMESVNPFLDWISDDFNLVRVGQSSSDPEEAWKACLADQEGKGAGHELYHAGSDYILPRLFEQYASRKPEAVLKVYFETLSKQEDGIWILLGFAKGSPVGFDWHGLAESVQSIPHGEDEYYRSPLRILAGRWLEEDANAAFVWYTRHASYDKFFELKPKGLQSAPKEEFVPPSDSGLRALALKYDLIEYLANNSRGDHSAGVFAGLNYLVSAGDPASLGLARRLIGECAKEEQNYPLLLRLMPNVKDKALAEELLLKVISSLPAFSRDDEMALPHPNPYLPLTHEILSQMNLSPAAQKQVDTVLKKVETLDEENRHALPPE